MRIPGRKKINTAVVHVTCGSSGPSYAEALSKAKKDISLEGLGISGTRIRNPVLEGLINRDPRKEASEKADCLTNRMRNIFKGKDIRILRPCFTADPGFRRLGNAGRGGECSCED